MTVPHLIFNDAVGSAADMVEQTAGRVPVQIDPSLPSAVQCSTVGAWRRGQTPVEIGKMNILDSADALRVSES